MVQEIRPDEVVLWYSSSPARRVWPELRKGTDGCRVLGVAIQNLEIALRQGTIEHKHVNTRIDAPNEMTVNAVIGNL